MVDCGDDAAVPQGRLPGHWDCSSQFGLQQQHVRDFAHLYFPFFFSSSFVCIPVVVFGGATYVFFLSVFFSGSALHRLLQTHFTSRRNDGESVVHVVTDQVTHALEPMVFCTNL